MHVSSIVDTTRYPINCPGTEAFDRVVEYCRDGLDSDGCAVIGQFLRSDALETITNECSALRANAHAVNRPWYPYPPYDHVTDGNWPSGHPRRQLRKRQNRFVAYDLLGSSSLLRLLYESAEMTNFIRSVLGYDKLYPYGDPLGACTLSIQEEGEQLPWHFDLTHFIVSLLIVAPEHGGRFNYAPRLRSDDDEHYEEVSRLLDGESRFVDLDLRPGDLQLFEGRNAMHRVTAPESGSWRCIALLAYCSEPDVIGSNEMQMNLFGRTHRTIKKWNEDQIPESRRGAH